MDVAQKIAMTMRGEPVAQRRLRAGTTVASRIHYSRQSGRGQPIAGECCHAKRRELGRAMATSFDLEILMRRLTFSFVVAISILAPSAGHAQATLNMTQVTCANYLAMSPDQARVFSAWMSGWFNQRWGYITVGFEDFARNVASVRQWCTGNPQATIMGALEHSIPQPGPPTGQIKVDMSLITCKQYLGSDAERQDMIAYWMSGYFGRRGASPYSTSSDLRTMEGQSATTARRMEARLS
jgi:HdeA/HdeB family